MNLPEINKNRQLGEKGLGIVKTIVESKLNWIFRKIPLDEDFGLDGYIDILKDDKYITGKSIAIQIKTGHSYFSNEASNGWMFSGKDKHLNYYSNLEIPIIIALVNPDTEDVFWAKFDIHSIKRTNSGWQLLIPKFQSLDNKAQLSSISNNFIDYTQQIENLSKIKTAILQNSIIYVAIEREEIENENYSGFIKLKKWLTSSDEMILKNRGKFFISIFGYDDDSRELFQIDEVRNWLQNVIPIFKYWGYFLYLDKPMLKYSSLSLLQICFIDLHKTKLDIKKQEWIINYDIKQAKEFKSLIFEWLNEFADKYAIEEKIVFEQSMKIFQTLDGMPDSMIDKMRNDYGFN